MCSVLAGHCELTTASKAAKEGIAVQEERQAELIRDMLTMQLS